MENVPPLAMNGDDVPSLDDLLYSKRNVKASRQKRSLALNSRTNADNDDGRSEDDSGLLTPPSSQRELEEDDMDPARMLFSPPPEEVLRGNGRSSTSRARSVPVQLPFTPSLLADPAPGAAASKRKRHAHQRSSSHTALSSIVDSPSTSQVPAEATPNPKPRKQSKRHAPTITIDSPTRPSAEPLDEPSTPTRASSQRRSQSPTKRSLFASPHHTNPDADYIAPLPVLSRQSLSARRRSATPIPPYEPPRERFTPPREIIHTPPPVAQSPSKVSKSSKRKSTAPKSKKKLVIQVKTEPPEVDLLEPPPPPSPTDDPLLLKGTDRPRRQHKPRVSNLSTSSSTHSRETPSIASSSPVSPPRAGGIGRLPDLNSSMDVSMLDHSYDSAEDSFAGPEAPVFDFTNAADNSAAWDDQESDDSDDFDQTGEYTGRFKILTVPTKADPPSSCTRTRQQAWGHPISPFPGSSGRRTSLPSSPPLRAGPDEDGEMDFEESPDEDDVFFLDGLVNADTSTDGDMSLETVDASEESMEIHETPRAHTPMRSPSPLPIVDVPESGDASIVHHPGDHHVRFAARRLSEEHYDEDVDMSMDDVSYESNQVDSVPAHSPPPSEEHQHGPSPEPEHANTSLNHASMSHDTRVVEEEHWSDSSDEETVDRELSREPDPESDDEDRPPRPTLLTPARAITPARSTSPQVRPRGFLSIASPLRRQKSPSVQARSVSPVEQSMPSIHSVFATPSVPRVFVEGASDSSARGAREETQETAVEEQDMDVEDGADAATEVEDGSSDENEQLDDGVIKITSGDPRVAARAAAILKMHDYDFVIQDPARKRRFSSVDSAVRNARRKSVVEGGITKHNTPVKRRRTFGGVLGDRVIIPGSPSMTVPELLHEAERTVEQRLHTPARATSFLSDSGMFKVPLDRSAFETPGPRQKVHARPVFNSSGPRSWDKDDWKLLDACFTDERLALGSHKRPLGEAVLASVEDVDLNQVVERFLEQTGGVPMDECWPGWNQEDLLRRTYALQKKQRSGKVAPPTPSGRFASVALSEVPDFTPLPSRQSSMQPGLQRRESASSAYSVKASVPASLLAPRYSHLLDEAIAISKGEGTTQSNVQPVEYRSTSLPAPETPNRPETEGTETANLSVVAPSPRAASERPQTLITPSRSIGSRMKGFFFSYLPTATKTTQPKKPAAPAHPGLPIPPPEMFQKPRPPISTPVSKPPSKTVHPKELVQLNHAPPPKPSRIPRFAQKPQRLVELHPAPPPPEPRPRSSLGLAGDRRSSSGSVKDLVRSFETFEKQQERERAEEATRLRRVRSVGEWAAQAGGRGKTATGPKRGTWKP
ncbi:uncharacterized protein TRAVEDRAFT_73651 [Trametes versicolor FP-101664 SS1]|uniref:uncharacterized protein n=1 Tax=Trametes versicolor (strain FP-101664) TaxID=717944 RepID=UPI00046240CB|nr:uncharacterized protein TRAVEDRAFT_73651 [Trametes versicolor FP-101664 SS1]EIW55932.1 hypothetical protein TRAVEDRAFT_73651 [Trametes versicolor FP-101664 SS1]